jgi:ankyrin repeat protein
MRDTVKQLMFYSSCSNITKLKEMVDASFDVTQKDAYGVTALHCLAR